MNPELYNPDAEVELLASILFEPAATIPEIKRTHPNVQEYFGNFIHRDIFAAAAGLIEAGQICEPVGLCEALKAAPDIRALIVAIQSKGISASLAGHYADMLKPLYLRRAGVEFSEAYKQASVNGDDAAMANALAKLTDLRGVNIPLADELAGRKFDQATKPADVRAVYTIGGISVATAGNIVILASLAKGGKSSLMGGFMAAPMAYRGSDTFTIESQNPEGRALLHVDTEQSVYDHWSQIDRARRRAGRETVPEWIQSYCLTGFSAKKARESVWLLADQAAKQFGGLHSIHIDGVADLVADVNDAEECNGFVAELHALAIKHDCPILGVIHINPNGEKTRGHLGSQLERKAETNLRIDKDGEVSEVWSEKQRRAPILKGKGPRFQWSTAEEMHLSIQAGESPKEIAKREDLKSLRDEVFQNRTSMRRFEAMKEVQTVTKKSDSTAKRVFEDWVTFGLVEKSFGNLWTPTT